MDKLEIKPIYSEEEAVTAMKNLSEFDLLIENAKLEVKEMQEKIKQAEKMRESVKDNLIEYYKDEIEMDDEFEFNCEYGEFKSRKSTKYNYTNEKSILSYLENNNKKLVRIKKEIDKNGLKKAYEVVDGKLYDADNDEFIEGVEIKKEITYSLNTTPKAVL